MGIFALRHSNRSIDEFLSLLQELRIETLVDIRIYPASIKFPYWNKDILKQTLEETIMKMKFLKVYFQITGIAALTMLIIYFPVAYFLTYIIGKINLIFISCWPILFLKTETIWPVLALASFLPFFIAGVAMPFRPVRENRITAGVIIGIISLILYHAGFVILIKSGWSIGYM